MSDKYEYKILKYYDIYCERIAIGLTVKYAPGISFIGPNSPSTGK
jgi:hypothetical protein